MYACRVPIRSQGKRRCHARYPAYSAPQTRTNGRAQRRPTRWACTLRSSARACGQRHVGTTPKCRHAARRCRPTCTAPPPWQFQLETGISLDEFGALVPKIARMRSSALLTWASLYRVANCALAAAGFSNMYASVHAVCARARVADVTMISSAKHLASFPASTARPQGKREARVDILRERGDLDEARRRAVGGPNLTT